MTNEHQASRTIVKSPPELWAECSDPGSLARHIGEFGEIRITRLEPETTVAWEGEHASGRVEIEPSGWGTKVTLTAETKVGHVVEEPTAVGQLAPNNGTESVEEAVDAKMEETSTQPDLAVATDPAPARGWKRVIARTRTLFRARTTAVPPAALPRGEPPFAQSAGSGYRMSGLDAGAPPEPWGVEPPVDAQAEPSTDPAESAPVETEPTKSLETETIKSQTAAPQPEEAPPSIDPDAVLAAALDSLGQAHHRPFSRA